MDGLDAVSVGEAVADRLRHALELELELDDRIGPHRSGCNADLDVGLGVELDGTGREFSLCELGAPGHSRHVDVDLDVDARRLVGHLELPAGL